MELQDYLLLICACLIVCFVLSFVINKLKERIIYDEIESFCEKKNLKYTKVTNERYDCILENDQIIIYLAIVRIKDNSSVTINSKNTWCLRYGGKRQGRNYPNKRYLNELKPFLSFNPNKNNQKEIYRVVVFHPGTEIILRYLNESEIMEVKPENVTYGFKAIKYQDLFEKFDELLINNKKDNNNPYYNKLK